MNRLVHDLWGIEMLADDILIYGSGDTMEDTFMDHNMNLENFFIPLRQKNCKLNKSSLF